MDLWIGHICCVGVVGVCVMYRVMLCILYGTVIDDTCLEGMF